MNSDPTGALQRLHDALDHAAKYDDASAIVDTAALRWAMQTITEFTAVASSIADHLDEANARLLRIVNQIHGQF